MRRVCSWYLERRLRLAVRAVLNWFFFGLHKLLDVLVVHVWLHVSHWVVVVERVRGDGDVSRGQLQSQ